ncbi:hypothetical protein M404DRAFT_23303 [Pisolithus tinctorius Marx 270]|uniref:Uncharacterized protein n=1 Tax=Pisolithus tinctorius Marx 270 TaxID=870435 RepID=A0A0C3PHT5_PISTI|nr:hypothetical protein M404DRAFT_23303 [Pisolithus tinctorius Marx 270]
MSSTCQVSLCKSNDPSGLQKATMPKLQITSDDEEADIWAKMAKHKQCKAAREEAAWLEAERLEREEQLEAERKEQEQLEAEHWEQEAQVQQKAGEPKGKAWNKGTSAVGARSCKQCKKGQCTKMKVRCELPEGVEPEVEETGAKSGKKQVLEDATLPRAGEKRKVVQTGSGVPSELEAGPSGVVASTTASSDPLVAAMTKGFELITAAIDCQTMEMHARRETQCQFNSWLSDLLGEFKFVLHPTPPVSKSSEELHLVSHTKGVVDMVTADSA